MKQLVNSNHAKKEFGSKEIKKGFTLANELYDSNSLLIIMDRSLLNSEINELENAFSDPTFSTTSYNYKPVNIQKQQEKLKEKVFNEYYPFIKQASS